VYVVVSARTVGCRVGASTLHGACIVSREARVSLPAVDICRTLFEGSFGRIQRPRTGWDILSLLVVEGPLPKGFFLFGWRPGQRCRASRMRIDSGQVTSNPVNPILRTDTGCHDILQISHRNTETGSRFGSARTRQ